MAIVAL